MTDIQPTSAPTASKANRRGRKSKAPDASRRILRIAARAAAREAPTPAVEPASRAPVSEPVVRTPATGKLGEMVALMRREGGASLADLMAATGWQAHSVRGALAGSLKRARGYQIASARIDGVRFYTIGAAV